MPGLLECTHAAYNTFLDCLPSLILAELFPLHPENVSRVQLCQVYPALPPDQDANWHLKFGQPYEATLWVDLSFNHASADTLCLGFVPVLTPQGTFWFGNPPVHEYVGVTQLRLKPEVRLKRRVEAVQSLGSAQVTKELKKFNARYKTAWTLEQLSAVEGSTDLGNYQVITIGDVLRNAVRHSLRKITRFFSLKPCKNETDYHEFLKPCLPSMFTNTVYAVFAHSPLLQILDKTNPLAEVAHKRKVTYCGRGGIMHVDRNSIPERLLDPSLEGILCPVETPESAHIGLNLHLAVEAELVQNESGASLVLSRQVGHPDAVLGISANLIPFIQHNEPNRAMMGAKNMKQALPLQYPEPPLIRTGWEARVGRESGGCIIANRSGTVLEVGAGCIRVRYDEEDLEEVFFLPDLPGNTPDVGGFYRVRVTPGTRFSAGAVLADASATENGVLALGRNLLVAYMPWYGYNFEDAVVLSRNAAQALTSMHFEENGDGRVKKAECLRIGDKISGRHGNKGVVALILPDAEMPRIGPSQVIDLLLNPHGVISRMNLGQLFETHWSWVAHHRGEAITVPPFSDEHSFDHLKRALEEAGLEPDGRRTVYWERDGRLHQADVVAGYQYILKLNHRSAKKLSARGATGERSPMTLQPVRGKKRGGGQRLGEMEVWALQAYGADITLGEFLTIKSDGLQSGVLPEASRVFLLHLRALGIDPRLVSLTHNQHTQKWEEHPIDLDLPGVMISTTGTLCLKLMLASSETILNWGKQVCATRYLADGMESRCENSSCDFRSDSFNGKWCPRCKTRVKRYPRYTPDGLMGKSVFGDLEGLERYQGGVILLNARVPHPLAPDDPDAMISTLYVLPPALRPIRSQGSLLDEGLNRFYVDILHADERLASVRANEIVDKVLERKAWKNLVRAVAALFGKEPSKISEIGKPVTYSPLPPSYQNRMNLMERIQGKAGIVRGYLLGKRTDFSGRAVIIPDPTIPLGACRLPQEIYEVFALSKSSSQTPVLLNRSPSLHRYNLLSFIPDPTQPSWKETALAIPPLVCAGFGADFDGDTMAIHLPISQDSMEEARDRMDARKHLFSVANGKLLLHMAQDIVAGIWVRTTSVAGREELANWLQDDRILFGTLPMDAPGLIAATAAFLRAADKPDTALEAVDRLVQRAFQEITEFGLSLSIGDLMGLRPLSLWWPAAAVEPPSHAWEEADLKKALERLPLTHPLAVLVRSGARGDIKQLLRLCVTASGTDNTIGSRSYVEGIQGKHYFHLAREARQEMLPKKLNTPQGGDLMRRLIYGCYPDRIVASTCADMAGLNMCLVWQTGNTTVEFFDQFLGKVAAETLPGLIAAGDMIDPVKADLLQQAGVKMLRIFSPVTCSADRGICARCYGTDMATGQPPEAGLPVGLIAAQSIGERATQDFMKVFQGRGDQSSEVEARYNRARSLLIWGKDPPELSAVLETDLWATRLAWLLSTYKQAVNLRHFELVLRRIKRSGSINQAAKERSNSKGAEKSPLAAAAYQSCVSTLFNAARRQCSDPLNVPPASLMLGWVNRRE